MSKKMSDMSLLEALSIFTESYEGEQANNDKFWTAFGIFCKDEIERDSWASFWELMGKKLGD